MVNQIQYNNGMGGSPSVPAPSDYKAFSITNIVLSVLCICNTGLISGIFAILALLKGNEVRQYAAVGDMGRAVEASSKAKLFNIIALCVLIAGVVLGIILSMTGFVASLFDNV